MATLRDKVIAQLRAVDRWMNPRTSSFKDVLVLLEKPLVDRTLQAAIDTIPVDKARKYRKALQVLMDERPALYYAAVSSFTARSTPSLTGGRDGSYVRYTSARFDVTVDLYLVLPKTVSYRAGLIQQCTAKTDLADYADNIAHRYHPLRAFPIGDSSGNGPFYHDGISYQCTFPCVQRVTWLDDDVRLQMNDFFNNNGHTFHPTPSPNSPNHDRHLQRLRRSQSFTMWAAIETPTWTRLLRKVSYTIDVKVTGRVLNKALHYSNSSTCRITPDVACTAAEQLPQVSAPNMNNVDRLEYRGPNGVWQPA